MLPNTKQKLKSDPSDVVSGLSSLSMPSLTPRQQLPMTKSFELRRNSSLLMRHKTTAETISETRRMLSNGMYAIVIAALKSKPHCIRRIVINSLWYHCNGDKKMRQAINTIKSDLK